MMLMRNLGNSDLKISAVGLGCNNFSRPGTPTETLEGTKSVLDAAIEHGITLLDTAELYGDPKGGSEDLIGQALVGRADRGNDTVADADVGAAGGRARAVDDHRVAEEEIVHENPLSRPACRAVELGHPAAL